MDSRFLEYSGLDACCTLEARNGFWGELANGFQPAYDRTLRMFEPLMFMQSRGLRVDLSAIEETKLEIAGQIEKAKEELNRLVGYEINANSPDQVAEYFYIKKGQPPYTNSEGRITTDDKAMQRLARPTAKRPGFREAKLVQDIRGLTKLKGTYLEVVVDKDGRLRCSWNPRGTKFGRLSSSETIFGTGLNLQNLHPQFKKFIWADEGDFFVEIDKRQAEWVLMAYLSQDANMLKVVEEGKDPHIFTGSVMFNIPEDIIRLDNKIVGYESDRNAIATLRMESKELRPFMDRLPSMMSGRQVGKHANHGLNYDEGYVRFSLEWELEIPFAKWTVEKYHQVYPGIRGSYYPWVKYQLSKDRTLTNCFGRKMVFREQWGNDLFKAGYSALPQSTQVDGLNEGLCAIYEDPIICSPDGSNADLMAQVHDSILMQFPISVLQELQTTIFYDIMKQVYQYVSPTMEYHGRSFKIATDMKVGYNWGAPHKETNPKGMQEVELGDNPDKFVQKVREILGVQA